MISIFSHCELQLQELDDLFTTFPTWIYPNFTVDSAFKFSGTKEKQKQLVPHYEAEIIKISRPLSVISLALSPHSFLRSPCLNIGPTPLVMTFQALTEVFRDFPHL
jgi:hypothetical protein